jgi:hypothetical protein
MAMQTKFIALGRNRNGMNKTETAHAADLELRKRIGEIQDYRWQPLRLKLAPDCTYEPDFLVLMADSSIEFHEVKGGFITDDGMVKVRVAAQLFPWFTFRLFQYDRKGCKIKELLPL